MSRSRTTTFIGSKEQSLHNAALLAVIKADCSVSGTSIILSISITVKCLQTQRVGEKTEGLNMKANRLFQGKSPSQ
jgi:hypothetical protein